MVSRQDGQEVASNSTAATFSPLGQLGGGADAGADLQHPHPGGCAGGLHRLGHPGLDEEILPLALGEVKAVAA